MVGQDLNLAQEIITREVHLLDSWLVIVITLAYLSLLFVIAELGERCLNTQKPRPWIYSLSLAIYCTSWAMFGTVAQSGTTGWFLAPTYFGTIILFVFAWPFLLRIIRIAKQNKVTSIADFIAGRFGSSHLIGGLVVSLCLVAIVPYISIQLKAIVDSFLIISTDPAIVNKQNINQSFSKTEEAWLWKDTGFYIALAVALFTILFGTRKIDATENHQGVVLAVAFGSVVKLVAFLVVGFFTVYFIFDGFADLWQQSTSNPITRSVIESRQPSFVYLSQAFLGVIAIICLPRQFHVLVVENRSDQELLKSRWIFPAYLLLINLFILPIALAGHLFFQGTDVSPENYSLLLPAATENPMIALLVFLGGVSAAISMAIVATIVLSTMICNEIIVPFSVKFFSFKLSEEKDLAKGLTWTRRVLILLILLLSYAYYRGIAVYDGLATTGLLSLSLIAQLAPAMIAGVYWKRCTQRATIAGLISGLLLWAYTMLLPLLSSAEIISPKIIEFGPWGFSLLKPTQLFGLYGFDTITHGLFWSLLVNCSLLIYFSLGKEQSLAERIQTSQFLSSSNNAGETTSAFDTELKIDDLLLLAKKFMGRQKAEDCFQQFCSQYNLSSIDKANINQLTRYTEKLLQGIIGSTSTRLIFESLANEHEVPFEDMFHVIDEAADVLLFNRELLQSAMENVSHGVRRN